MEKGHSASGYDEPPATGEASAGIGYDGYDYQAALASQRGFTRFAMTHSGIEQPVESAVDTAAGQEEQDLLWYQRPWEEWDVVD